MVREIKKPAFESETEVQMRRQRKQNQLQENRKKMLDAIGQSSYNGIDLFEGTTPMSSAGDPSGETQAQSPLSGVDPSDPGIDISGLMGNVGTWKTLAEGKK